MMNKICTTIALNDMIEMEEIEPKYVAPIVLRKKAGRNIYCQYCGNASNYI